MKKENITGERDIDTKSDDKASISEEERIGQQKDTTEKQHTDALQQLSSQYNNIV